LPEVLSLAHLLIVVSAEGAAKSSPSTVALKSLFKAEADKALAAAKAAFGGGGDVSQIPSKELPASALAAGMGVLDLFVLAGLAASKGEARRLVQQGGAVVNDKRIDDEKAVVDETSLDADGALTLRAGKKRVFRLVVARG